MEVDHRLMDAHQNAIDPVWLVGNLPAELKHEIKNFTFLAQMRERYDTDDLETIATQVCREPASFGKDVTRGHWMHTLLDFGAPIRSIPNRRMTVFHHAAFAQDTRLIRRLVRLGYDINEVDIIGLTAVSRIAFRMRSDNSYLPVLRVLCEEGADVNVGKHGDAQILYWLLITMFDSRTRTRCHTNDMGEALKLLLKHGASLSGALHAVGDSDSNAPFIKPLLESGADIEEVWNEIPMTPLTRAASLKNPAIVQALIDAGANINGDGKTLPLFAAIDSKATPHIASTATITTTINVLCDAGADMMGVDDNNHSIISYALIQFGYAWTMHEIIEALCKAGADANFRHEGPWIEGDTPLHIAARMDYPFRLSRTNSANCKMPAPTRVFAKCIETLISYGANVDAQNDDGRTPLHEAAKCPDLFSARVLLQHGARTDLKDNDGKTALMLTVTCNEEMIALLMS